MGNDVSTSLADFFLCKKRKFGFMIQGLDASGKTTLLHLMKSGEVVVTIATIGVNVETWNFEGIEYTGWDVGSRDKMRFMMLHHGMEDNQGLIIVVDSSDIDRMYQARDEFHRAMDLLKTLPTHRPVLLLCNKQDKAHVWSPEKIGDFFGIEKENSPWIRVMGGSVTEDRPGIMEGLQWLGNAMEMAALEGPKLQETAPLVNPERQKLSYNPSSNYTLRRFYPIKRGTSCPFAKTSRLWGGICMEEDLPAGETMDWKSLAQAHAQALTEFVERIRDDGEALDGFCIEIVDPRAKGDRPEDFGECVREMLTALSDLDPAGERVMRANYIGSRGWRFRFHGTDFFVTTFAPCYDKSSSRYAYGTGRAFVLLQPESSFARHDLPPDTPHTEWEQPKTIRDKTRVAFKKAGQSYFIPETTSHPAANHIVKPLKDDGVAVVRWWQEQSAGGESSRKRRV